MPSKGSNPFFSAKPVFIDTFRPIVHICVFLTKVKIGIHRKIKLLSAQQKRQSMFKSASQKGRTVFSFSCQNQHCKNHFAAMAPKCNIPGIYFLIFIISIFTLFAKDSKSSILPFSKVRGHNSFPMKPIVNLPFAVAKQHGMAPFLKFS